MSHSELARGLLGGTVGLPASAPGVPRSSVVATSRTWLDTPWRHGQRTKGVGADCIGLVAGVGLELGMPSAIAWARDPEMRGYAPTPNVAMLLAAVTKYLDPIEDKRQAQLGDILLLSWEGDEEPAHFAIVSSLVPLRVIHSYRSARKVAENNIADRWRHTRRWDDLVLSAWCYKEIVD